MLRREILWPRVSPRFPLVYPVVHPPGSIQIRCPKCGATFTTSASG